MVQLDDPKLGQMLDEPEELPRMSFGDHLDELRKRVIRSLLAIFIAILGVLPFKHEVQEIIVGPYRAQWQSGFEAWVDELEAREKSGELASDEFGVGFLKFCRDYKQQIFDNTFEYPQQVPMRSGYPVPYSLYATGGIEDMLSFMWASLVFALVLASPVVLWQAWAFIAAGLYPKERRVFYRYFPFMVGLFASGILFGYHIALPYCLGFLISLMDPAQVGAIFSVGQFWSLEFMTTAALGVMFQLPMVMLALQKVGLVRHKAFRKHWRVTVLVIFVASAMFTPPEPVSMMLMSMPMMLLFGIGLLLTKFGEKNESEPAPPVEAT